jgi:hypothetical protein
MESTNPYAAPPQVGSESDGVLSHDLRGLVSLRRAVRWAGVATVLVVLGFLFVVLSGVVQNFHLPQEIRQRHSILIMLVYRSTQLVILALATGYTSLQVWRYSGVLSAALREQPVSAATLLAAQRRCWYAAAGVMLFYIVTYMAAPFVTIWAYR